MKTADVLNQLTPKTREAAVRWLAECWFVGKHGLPLAEMLMDAAPGKIDGLDAADRILKAAERDGWISRGKLELHTVARRMSAACGARLLDYYWEPVRGANSRSFWEAAHPDADADTRDRCAAHYGWPVSHEVMT